MDTLNIIKILKGELSAILIFPKEWIDSLRLENNDFVELTIDQERIIVQKSSKKSINKE